jgi:outer membrane protein assembly factor BamD (BamD/ComL family)
MSTAWPPSLVRSTIAALLLSLVSGQAFAEGHGEAKPAPSVSKADGAHHPPGPASAVEQTPSTPPADGKLPFLDDGTPLSSKNLIPPPKPDTSVPAYDFQKDLDYAREQRRQLAYAKAEAALEKLMTTNAPAEFHRQALLELALVAQDQHQLTRAAQVFSQYIQRFPEHPTVPEVYLRQGLIYRELGAHRMAVSRFYLVMSSSLQLKLDQMAYYKRLVLQAQTEIADTIFLDANYEEAARLYERMLKQEATELNRPHVHYKLIRCLSSLDKNNETIAEGEAFLEKYPETEEVPEVRFTLARIYKQLGRNGDATRQVLGLLEQQKENQKASPERWAYWQQRAGNDLANQFYRDGDFLNALAIYNAMAAINTDPAWQLPVLYQTGLIYERLEQTAKATEVYGQILDAGKTVDPDTAGPALKSVIEMARWRKDHIAWINKSAIERELLRPPAPVGNAAASL